jgi:PIN domain nuclease of toxin-antitoxin system
MKLLLDTHLLLWAAGLPEKLPAAAHRLIDSSGTDLFFSAASIWEIAIKRNLNRPDFQVDPHHLRRGLLSNGYAEVAITGEHVQVMENLPHLHKDPFDRLLIAQATAEGLTLLTADANVALYPGPVRMV